MKDLLLRARVVVRNSNMQISRRRLADSVKNCIKKRAVRAARLLFIIQPIKSLICGVVVAVLLGSLRSKTRESRKRRSKLQVRVFRSISLLCQFV